MRSEDVDGFVALGVNAKDGEVLLTHVRNPKGVS